MAAAETGALSEALSSAEIGQSAADEPLKFKVRSDGYSLTLGPLDAKWLSKPFAAVVLKPFVSKFNRREDKLSVSLEQLHGIAVDGVPLTEPLDAKTTLVSDVISPGTEHVDLTFGEMPPEVLKFPVRSGEIEFVITLDKRWMRKSFEAAVIVPFVTLYNKRVSVPVKPEDLVEYQLNGKKPAGSCAAEKRREALTVLGHHTSHVELYFSWEQLKRDPAKGLYAKLRFVTNIEPAELQRAKNLTWDHLELTAPDGEEIAKAIVAAAPLPRLRHIYLFHNDLRDVGLASLCTALTQVASLQIEIEIEIGVPLENAARAHPRVTHRVLRPPAGAAARAQAATPRPQSDRRRGLRSDRRGSRPQGLPQARPTHAARELDHRRGRRGAGGLDRCADPQHLRPHAVHQPWHLEAEAAGGGRVRSRSPFA
jgi:hypothetical protein